MLKILLPVDGSPAALAAVGHALGLRREGLPAAFVLVNVQEPASLYEMVVAHDADVIARMRSLAGAETLAPAEALLEHSGAAVETEVAGGSPAALLLELLENYQCDAVVMGARGMGDPHAAGLGSVVLAVLQHCPVPVTVVRVPPAVAEARDDDSAAQPSEPPTR